MPVPSFSAGEVPTATKLQQLSDSITAILGLKIIAGSSVVTTNGAGGLAFPLGYTFSGTPMVSAWSGDYTAFEGFLSDANTSVTTYNGMATLPGGARATSRTIRVNWIVIGPA